MQRSIKRCAIEASYNIEGTLDECEAAIRSQAGRELRDGKQVNHLLKRSSDNPGLVKFTSVCLYYPNSREMIGVPLLAHSLVTAGISGLETVVVGNEDCAEMAEQFTGFARSRNLEIKPFRFVHEGEQGKLSRANTIKKTIEGLRLFKGYSPGNILSFSPDSPFVHPDAFLSDPDSLSYDLVLNINNREISGDEFPRNGHWWLEDDDGKSYFSKEPNVYVWNPEKLLETRHGPSLPDMIYDSRKFYGNGKSMVNTILGLVGKDDEGNEWVPGRVIKSLGMLGQSGRYQIAKLLVRKMLGMARSERHAPRISASAAQAIGEYALGNTLSIRMKPCMQPGAMIDIDSLEDVVFVQGMIDENPSVYPYHCTLVDFAKYAGSRWKTIADNWRDIANADFEKWDINARYLGPHGRLSQGLFSNVRIAHATERIASYNRRWELRSALSN